MTTYPVGTHQTTVLLLFCTVALCRPRDPAADMFALS